jgi:hypothetical protein
MTAPGTIPTVMKTTSSPRRPPPEQDAGEDQRRGDDDRERDRAPTHGEIAEQPTKGSKSKVTAAIGTVGQSLTKAIQSASRHVWCRPSGSAVSRRPTSSPDLIGCGDV